MPARGKARTSRPRLVLVEWLDSSTHMGWEDEATVRAQKPIACKTVGWLIHEDKKALRMAASMNTLDDWNDRSTIPRGCVIRIHRIKEGK